MRTKLLIIFSLAMIFALIAGCSSSIEEEIRDMHTFRGGFLSSGRRFTFSGSAEVIMKLEEFFEVWELSYLRSYDFIIQEETVEDILERPEIEILLEISHLEPDSMGIHVGYFPKSRDLIFMAYHEVYYNLYRAEGLSVIVVNHESGAVSHYYNSRRCTVSQGILERNTGDR